MMENENGFVPNYQFERQTSDEKKPLKILLVEDDEDDAFIVKDLIREGMQSKAPEVDHSTNTRDALKAVKKCQYDLFMFDYRLGEIDGINLLNTIRELGIQTPIIFLTGQGDQEIAVEAMKAGATDYLTKGNLTAKTLSYSIRYSIQLNREAERRRQAEVLLKKSHEEVMHKNDELNQSLQKLQTAQNQILRSEKLAGIGRLAAGVCHEILNPLNIISGHVQALQMEREDDPNLIGDLESVMEEIQRIEKIIGGLLKFSRKGGVELSAVDINQELDSVMSIMEREMNLEGIEIVRDYIEDPPKLLLDVDRMRQVFLNIINNARHALQTKGGGTLTVSTMITLKDRRKRRIPDPTKNQKTKGFPFLSIRFKDTGCGIRKEYLDRLFDPFFTTKPEDKGTGLGLSVCYTIIEKHSGTLEVESEFGKGATFTIDLPIKDEKQENKTGEAAPPAQPTAN